MEMPKCQSVGISSRCEAEKGDAKKGARKGGAKKGARKIKCEKIDVGRSYDKIKELAASRGSVFNILVGEEGPLSEGHLPFEGAKSFIEEVGREHPHKLYILRIGAPGTVAGALKESSCVGSEMIVATIGGLDYRGCGTILFPGLNEFNFADDVRALNALFALMPRYSIYP